MRTVYQFKWTPAGDPLFLPAHRREAGLVRVSALGIPLTSSNPEAATQLAAFLVRYPERGVPALMAPATYERFSRFYDRCERHPAVLQRALDKRILPERHPKDPRIGVRAIRTRPWNLMREQPWTAEVAEEYRRTIREFFE